MTLTKEGYRPRIVDRQIAEALKTYGAVHIQGTKYCGKTWTSMNHAESMYALDDQTSNYRNLRLARVDGNYALDGGSPHLIDEWQMVPGLWDGVRRAVDMGGGSRKFILTGSSSPEEPKDDIIPHSGIGRIETVPMRTMSLFESGDSDGSVSLKGLFASDFANTEVKEKRLENLIDLTIRGGWPGNITPNEDGSPKVMTRYAEDVCRMDLPRVDRSKSPTRMERLIRSLARNESTLANMSVLARDMEENEGEEILSSTVSGYMDVLHRMCLLNNQPAFSPAIRSSVNVGKMPKRHLADPAIAASALGLDRDALLDDLNTYGFLFEAMCERDLDVYAQAMGGRLLHYRDGAGREIDAVVELRNRKWAAFEIKLGDDQIDAAAKNLKSVTKYISDRSSSKPKDPEFLCVISGMESAAYRREDGVYVVPITALRD